MTVDHVVAIDIGATKTLLAMRPVAALEAGWALGGPLERIESDLEPDAFVEWVTSEVDRALAGRSGRIDAWSRHALVQPGLGRCAHRADARRATQGPGLARG